MRKQLLLMATGLIGIQAMPALAAHHDKDKATNTATQQEPTAPQAEPATPLPGEIAPGAGGTAADPAATDGMAPSSGANNGSAGSPPQGEDESPGGTHSTTPPQ